MVAALLLIPPAIPFLFLGGGFAVAARAYASFVVGLWFKIAVWQIGACLPQRRAVSVPNYTPYNSPAVPFVLTEVVNGVRFVVTGDKLQKESAILISNHRTRLDWMLLWAVGARAGTLSMLKIVLKAGLKKAPCFGFVMQTLGFLFLERDWTKDELHMQNMCEAHSERETQLLLFPEGTDLSPSNLEKSQAFSKKAGLPVMQHVLVPRSKGFVCCLEKLRGGSCKALYDITLGFPDTVPQSENTIFNATWPKEIHVHVQRHALDLVPTQDVEQWMQDKFVAKEKRLELFAGDKKFAGAKIQYEEVDICGLCMDSLVFFGMASALFLYLLFTTSWYLYFCMIALAAQHAATVMGGIDKMVLGRWVAERAARRAKTE